jgi:predicted lactoylglutathione lyase
MADKRSRKIFVNLAVRDLKKSMDFFSKLGFTFNPKFTDDNAACMIIGDEAYVMLLANPSSRRSRGVKLCNTARHV